MTFTKDTANLCLREAYIAEKKLTMAAKNLDEMKRRLLQAFNLTMEVGLADMDINSIPNRTLAAELLKAAAAIAGTITNIEKEQREAQEGGRIRLAKPAS